MNKTREELRLADLESYELDNGYPKEQLKSIIKLASEICGTPISLIDIIDDFNQRTIATHGEWEEKIIPRNKSICDKAVVEDGMLIIDDVEKNEEISSRLSTEDKKKIRFYAGAPLKSSAGFNLGALCVIDSKPRQLTNFQKESLQVLANEVMARLDLHKQTKLLKRQNNKLEKYSIFLNNSADILCIIDSKTDLIIDINEDCHKELGYTRDDLLQKRITDFVDTDIDVPKTIESWFAETKNNRKRLSIPLKLKNKHGYERWYKCNFTTEKGHWYLTARNITQLKKAEIQQKSLLSRLQHANHLAELGYWELDFNKDSITFDDEMFNILGLKNGDKKPSLDLFLNRLNDSSHNKFLEFIQAVKYKNEITEYEHHITTTDATKKYLVHRGELIHENGIPTKMLFTTQDITDRKIKELQISESLEEKEILLSEIHHRVKNNLAIISGLLELNLFQVEGISTTDFIRSSQLRIKSMAKIHEKLYQSGTFTHVSFKDYIQELIETIQNTMKTGCDPEIKTKIEDINLNINYAIPCGLILNELITNAWKHAFPNQEPGTIKISFYRKDSRIHLCVKDDGVGLPEDINNDVVEGLGLRLIKILSKQIEAELSIGNSKDGFSCKLTFVQKENRKGSSSTFT